MGRKLLIGKTPENIFIVKHRAFGDSVMGLSTVQYVRELFPESKIIYGVPKWVAPLYDHVLTAAHEILPFDLNGVGDWISLWKTLRARKVDAIHEMHQSGRTQKFFNLYSKVYGVPYTAHNHHLKEGTDVIDQGIIKSLIQRDLDGVCSFWGDRDEIPNFLNYPPKIECLMAKEDLVFFGVVATRKTKMWPLSYFVDLAKLINSEYPDLKIVIPLSNSIDDAEIQNELNKLGMDQYAEYLKVPLSELPIVMAKGKFYIGNDTGLKHLAISLGLKTWTFFGPEPPNEWHPYEKSEHDYFYIDELDCRTVTHHYCGLSECDSMICLNQTLPHQVYSKVKDLF